MYPKTPWFLYLIHNKNRCYIGISTDIERRLKQHNKIIPGGAKATSMFDGGWVLVAYLSGFNDRSSASRWEKIVKSRSRGLEKRLKSIKELSEGICPTKGLLPHYIVPPLVFHEKMRYE
jgi:putative endonuclease